MRKTQTEFNWKHVVALFLGLSSAAWAAKQPEFSVKTFTRDVNGVTVVSLAGTMRIEVCGDRAIHVVASPTSEIPASKVPVAIQPCNAQNFQIVSVKKKIKLSTNALTVSVDTETGALTFFSGDGKTVLAEPKEGGKQFDVPSLFEAKTWQVQQTFLSPPD